MVSKKQLPLERRVRKKVKKLWPDLCGNLAEISALLSEDLRIFVLKKHLSYAFSSKDQVLPLMGEGIRGVPDWDSVIVKAYKTSSELGLAFFWTAYAPGEMVRMMNEHDFCDEYQGFMTVQFDGKALYVMPEGWYLSVVNDYGKSLFKSEA